MHRRFQIAIVAVTWVLLPVSFIGADYLRDQPLQHAPTVLGLATLSWFAMRGNVNDVSMVSMVLFIWLHTLGARYIYSYVPYDQWSQKFFGFSITRTFHFTRNHYDRLVHFAFGVLAMPPLVELLRRRWKLGREAVFLSFALVLALGACYEIVEWLMAVIVAPHWADRYNGQQGDAWDSQKDMACAALGALLAALVMLAEKRSSAKRATG